MASGHVNRTNRPNTWLLRPMLQSEECSCQPGAVHTWPRTAADRTRREVGCQALSRPWLDRSRLRPCDPYVWTGCVSQVEIVRGLRKSLICIRPV